MNLLTLVSMCSVILMCYAAKLKEVPLSDHEHFTKDDEHNHDTAYDHDAFLGRDVAKEYDELTPEESKEKLGKLFHKVDDDSDNFVTEDELKKWIKNTQHRYIIEDGKIQMKAMDTDEDGFVSWMEYKENTFSDADKNDGAEDETKRLMARDEKRFKMADIQQSPDTKLDSEELAAFLHPESHPHMKDYVVNEAFEDMDKNKDGAVSLDEYIGDLYRAEDHADEKEPDWVETERTMFREERDVNKDGNLDMEEVRQFIIPDHDDEVGVGSEAQHLILECDSDKDGKISKDEMVDNYNVFVGSQFTEFGDIFQSEHTEL